MFDILDAFKKTGHFFLTPGQNLEEVCNAPNDQSRVFLVYALKGGRVELVYVGHSGRLRPDGTMFVRKKGLGGLKDRIINGNQFGKTPRYVSWPKRMKKDKIEALDIYWYAVPGTYVDECPIFIEKQILMLHLDSWGQLPQWNDELY